MEFVGENLWPGKIGHFLIVLSLISSLLATFAYYQSFKAKILTDRPGWLRLARTAFFIETVSVIGTFFTLYYIISHHLFEYKYAWQHSSRSLQVEYLLSCFWEGQEGSFLLWSFWHCVLGWPLIKKGGKWEGPTMTVLNAVQFVLATMVLGVYIFGHKIGSNPFVLLRNEMDAPIFSQPNYLQFVKDGNGLNALLQNYWMVIHPPVLFLGFAATVIPFAYAVGGLLADDYKGWTTPALPWASFAAATLGAGIMMGAAWAYESLTFGGYWAWDPVENASLVPWLLLISGLHTNLIYKNSGYSLKATYLFYFLAFWLIVYSTFLTRSGILGDTSVHAFTDLGMNTQLMLFLAAAILPSAVLYLVKQKHIPTIQKEENIYSREFWMFIGSLVFFLAAAVIIGKTSLPVYNKIFGTKIAPPQDVEYSHNQIQVWVAVIVGLLSAVTQFMRYKDTPPQLLWKRLLWPTVISLALGTFIAFTVGISYDKKGIGFQIALFIAMFMSVFAIVTNAGYIWSVLKGKIRLAGASVAHIGFGMVLLGILLASGNRTILSYNTTGISPLKANDKENGLENTTLIKGVKTDMGRYMVTYVSDTLNPKDRKWYYKIDFEEKGGGEKFSLYPDVIENNKGMEGMSANPSARHYLHKDIFAYLTYLRSPRLVKDDTAQYRSVTAVVGDTMFYSRGQWVVNRLDLNADNEKWAQYKGDTVISADVTVKTRDGKLYRTFPAFRIKDNQLITLPDTVMSQGLILALRRPGNLEKKELEMAIKESDAVLDFVTLKVYEFPWINILWLGIVVTVIGFVMSMIQRARAKEVG